MTTTTETVAPASGECSADLFLRLAAEGANLDHLRAVADAEREFHNAQAVRLARLYFEKPEGAKITASDFCDRLENLAARSWGVVEAVCSLAQDNPGKASNGVSRLVQQLALDLERISEAFASELMADWRAPSSSPQGLSPFAMALIECQGAHLAFKRSFGTLADINADLLKLARTPCEASEVATKLRVLLNAHKEQFGARWREELAPAVMEAIELHFGEGGEAEAADETEEPEARNDEKVGELLQDPAIAEAVDALAEPRGRQ